MLTSMALSPGSTRTAAALCPASPGGARPAQEALVPERPGGARHRAVWAVGSRSLTRGEGSWQPLPDLPSPRPEPPGQAPEQ